MKKRIYFLIVATLMISLVGCSDGYEDNLTNTSTTSDSVEEPTTNLEGSEDESTSLSSDTTTVPSSPSNSENSLVDTNQDDDNGDEEPINETPVITLTEAQKNDIVSFVEEVEFASDISEDDVESAIESAEARLSELELSDEEMEIAQTYLNSLIAEKRDDGLNTLLPPDDEVDNGTETAVIDNNSSGTDDDIVSEPIVDEPEDDPCEVDNSGSLPPAIPTGC
jgi:predicted small lipoprotein YifL